MDPCDTQLMQRNIGLSDYLPFLCLSFAAKFSADFFFVCDCDDVDSRIKDEAKREKVENRDSQYILEFVICLLSDKNPFVCDYDMHSPGSPLAVFWLPDFSSLARSRGWSENLRRDKSISRLRICIHTSSSQSKEIPKFRKKFPSSRAAERDVWNGKQTFRKCAERRRASDGKLYIIFFFLPRINSNK